MNATVQLTQDFATPKVTWHVHPFGIAARLSVGTDSADLLLTLEQAEVLCTALGQALQEARPIKTDLADRDHTAPVDVEVSLDIGEIHAMPRKARLP